MSKEEAKSDQIAANENEQVQSQEQQQEDDQSEEAIVLDQIIDDYFLFEEQRRRFKNDIGILLEKSSALKVKVDLEHSETSLSVIIGLITNQFDFCSGLGNNGTLNFEVQVHQRYYPNRGTRIFCKSPLLSPCLCDGRDFSQEVLGQVINSANSIANANTGAGFLEIAEKLIEFVREIVKHKTESLYLQRIGRYYLGAKYIYDDIKQFTSLVRVPCVQFEDNFFTKLHVRIIGITEGQFLVFDAEDTEKKHLKLLFWSDLQSISEIKRRKEDPTKLTFKWRQYVGRSRQTAIHSNQQSQSQQAQTSFVEQTFQIPEPEGVIQQILRRVRRFQSIKISSNQYMNGGSSNNTNSADEVMRENIVEATQRVFKYEQEIKHKFNIANVETLIQCYNQVIEHYSSLNDYLSEIFLNSLHNLLNRPDVQCLLNYSSPTNSKPVAQAPKISPVSLDSVEESSQKKEKSLDETGGLVVKSEQQSNQEEGGEEEEEEAKIAI